MRRAAIIAEAVGLARGLANQPSLTKSPQWLADEATRVTAGRDVTVRVWAADELAYAAATLEPDQIIDVATVTGAARVVLGTTHAALYATNDGLAESLISAGQASGERVWRMPLEDDYLPALASDVADLSHISRAETTMPGSIIAALFLRLLTQP